MTAGEWTFDDATGECTREVTYTDNTAFCLESATHVGDSYCSHGVYGDPCYGNNAVTKTGSVYIGGQCYWLGVCDCDGASFVGTSALGPWPDAVATVTTLTEAGCPRPVEPHSPCPGPVDPACGEPPALDIGSPSSTADELTDLGSIEVSVDADICGQTAARLQETLEFAAKILVANKDLVTWAICRFADLMTPPSAAVAQEMTARAEGILSGAEWPAAYPVLAGELAISEPYPCDSTAEPVPNRFEASTTEGGGTTFIYYQDSERPSLLAAAALSYDGLVSGPMLSLAAVMAHELMHHVDPDFHTTDVFNPSVGEECTVFTYAFRLEIEYHLKARYSISP